jgi:hypothetical protein
MGKKRGAELTVHQRDQLVTQVDHFDFAAFRVRQYGKDVKHVGSFKGKDFKILFQYMIFPLASCGASEEVLDIWEELGLVQQIIVI